VAFELHPGRGAAADARSPLVDVSAGGGAGAHPGALGVSHRGDVDSVSDRPQHRSCVGRCSDSEAPGTSLFSFDHLDDVLVFLGTAILVPGIAALGFVTAGKYFLLRGNDPVAWMVCVILGFAEPHLADQHGDFPAVCSGDSADCITRPLLDSDFEVQAVGGSVRAGRVAACNRLSDFWTGLCKSQLGAGNISDFTAAAAVGGDPVWFRGQ